MKSIIDVQPVGNYVLVEKLTPQESLNTNLLIATDDKASAPQAIVLAIGPLVNPNYGIKVGQRVLIQGSYVPAPNFNNNGREKHVLLPDMIKAILVDE